MSNKDLEIWKRCVRKVKRVHGINDKFTLIRGATLSQSQSCYCAVLQATPTTNLKKKKSKARR